MFLPFLSVGKEYSGELLSFILGVGELVDDICVKTMECVTLLVTEGLFFLRNLIQCHCSKKFQSGRNVIVTKLLCT